MPNIICQAEINLDFEVFCGSCESGLCNNTTTRLSRSREYPQIVVDVCPYCIGEKNNEIEKLENDIDELKEEIERLNHKLNEYEEETQID